MAIHVSSPADDVVALTDVKEIPGLGFLPVNAYVVHAEQPLLVDSGLPTSRPDFLQALWTQIEPADLRWIYLTHPDRDHTGSLMEILQAAPAARLVTTFLGLGILSLEYQIDLDRIFLLNPGQSLDLGDRHLTAFRRRSMTVPRRPASTTSARELASHLTASAPRSRSRTRRRSTTSRHCPPMICSRGSGFGRASIVPG